VEGETVKHLYILRHEATLCYRFEKYITLSVSRKEL
jgi:hypothetical protein